MFKNSAQEGITSQLIALTLNKIIKKCERPDLNRRTTSGTDVPLKAKHWILSLSPLTKLSYPRVLVMITIINKDV
jgi:hypothetical protein